MIKTKKRKAVTPTLSSTLSLQFLGGYLVFFMPGISSCDTRMARVRGLDEQGQDDGGLIREREGLFGDGYIV
jgi:hypothetical protein